MSEPNQCGDKISDPLMQHEDVNPPRTVRDDWKQILRALRMNILQKVEQLLCLEANEIQKKGKTMDLIRRNIKDLIEAIDALEKFDLRQHCGKKQKREFIQHLESRIKEQEKKMKQARKAKGAIDENAYNAMKEDMEDLTSGLKTIREFTPAKMREGNACRDDAIKKLKDQEIFLKKTKKELLDMEAEIAGKISGIVIKAFFEYNVPQHMVKLKTKMANEALAMVHETFVDVKKEWAKDKNYSLASTSADVQPSTSSHNHAGPSSSN